MQDKISGEIGYYGLSEWYLENFNSTDTQNILDAYKPFQGSSKELLYGDFSSSQSIIFFLSGLAQFFKKDDLRGIGYKFLLKGSEYLSLTDDILDKHFFFHNQIIFYYRFRELDDFAYPTTIKACEDQIEISEQAILAFLKEYPDTPLPSHTGYHQLSIILEKNDEYNKSIELCKKALLQGWSGDWEKRINRLFKKSNK